MRRIVLPLVAVLSLSSFATAAEPVRASGGSPGPNISHAAAVRELEDTSAVGMNKRFGPDYSVYHKSDETLPDIYLVPKKPFPSGKRVYQYGDWQKSAGDFSSTQGQILYASEKGTGVDRVTIIEWTNGVFTESPEAPWNTGSHPDPTSKKWKNATGAPIATARGMGGWSNCGLVVFASGFIGTAGTVTAHGSNPTLQLPPNKLPTSVSITNKNEFALITVVDTTTGKGQLAVISLISSGQKRFAHEWQDEYPGVPNVGLLWDMKLLGFIDLPGITVPTSVSAVGNHLTNRMNGRDGNAGILREYDLAKQEDRDVFNKGSNANFSSSAGFAVVASKSENKVAFVDLQPLFERVRAMFFTTEENFQKTRDMGPGPKQWPYTFDGDPTWKPVAVKTIDVPEPTAVIATLSGGESKARACIASLDGTVHFYKVGGLASDAEAKADDIEPAGELKIGRNPICLTYQKGKSDLFIAVCRGDRSIVWFSCDDKNTGVVRTLQDARMIDPVYVEVSDTHGVSAGIITVADFKGKQILNYRYTVLHFATQGGAKYGMGKDGDAEFECGGVMPFQGYPFSVSATNVN